MKPTVKPSERSRILSTKDFSLFEFPDVKISKKHLEWVKESILEKNLLPDYPILVDEKYNILDGKYKFLACYELKIPINYKIAEVTNIFDATRVKQIHLSTPINKIIELYKDKENFANIIFIKSLFNNVFSYQEILSLLDSACKPIKKTVPYSVINKYKLASGKLDDFNLNDLERKLLRVKHIIQEYEWPIKCAISLVKFYGSCDFVIHDKLMKKVIKDPYKYSFSKPGLFIFQRYIAWAHPDKYILCSDVDNLPADVFNARVGKRILLQ